MKKRWNRWMPAILSVAVCLAMWPVSTGAAVFDAIELDHGMQMVGGAADLSSGAANWNANFGSDARIQSGYLYGRIATSEQRRNAVNQVLAWDYAPSGDFSEPMTVGVTRVSEEGGLPSDAIENWRRIVNEQVRIGHYVYVMNWTSSSRGTFQTLAVVDQQTVIWDNMLSSAAFIHPLQEEESTLAARTTTLKQRVDWLWGSRRGLVTIQVQSICSGEGSVRDCLHSCTGFMQIGTAKVNCKEPRVVGNACKLDYSYALATPLVDITVKNDNFTVEAKGLGSRVVSTGSIRATCP